MKPGVFLYTCREAKVRCRDTKELCRETNARCLDTKEQCRETEERCRDTRERCRDSRGLGTQIKAVVMPIENGPPLPAEATANGH